MPNDETTTTQSQEQTQNGFETSTSPPPAEGSFEFQDPPEQKTFDLNAFVPDEYREKEWIQNISKSENPQLEFFKQFEEVRSLVGRKNAQIPTEASTPEEWKAYYQAIGVPESVEGYEVKPIAWDEKDKEAGTFLESTRHPDFLNKVKEGVLKLGITPAQFQGLVELHDRTLVEVYRNELQSGFDTNAKLDADFDQYMRRIHGNNTDQAYEFGSRLLNESVDLSTKQFIDELAQTPEGTKALAVLSGAMYGFYKKYVGEDTINTSGHGETPTGVAPGMSEIDAISAKCRELMSTPAYNNYRHPECSKIRGEVERLYARQKELMASGQR